MAVYTSLSQNDVRNFLDGYSIGKLIDFEGISAGVTNSNFFINCDSGKYVLTLFEQESFEDIALFSNLMSSLAKFNYPCPDPIKDKNKKIIQELKNKPAIIISLVPGKITRTISVNHCKHIGEKLAELHLLTKKVKFSRKNKRDFAWIEATFDKVKINLKQDEKLEIEKELLFLKENTSDQLPQGLIHADLFHDNVLFKEDGSVGGVIDFYYASIDKFIYDIAIVVNDWCVNKIGKIDLKKFNAFINAYNSVRKILPDEMQKMNIYLRLAAMRFLISRFFDFYNQRDGEIKNVKDPHYFLNILKNRQEGN